MAGVANIGDDPNWTGHHLAQANLYGFGRLAWCPDLAADQIAWEWAGLTFGDDPLSAEVVTKMLMGSGPAYESYTTPLGLGWMVTPGDHYEPSPDGYEYSRWGTYHFADSAGIGVDRTTSHGTGFTAQYREPWRTIFEDPLHLPRRSPVVLPPPALRLRIGRWHDAHSTHVRPPLRGCCPCRGFSRQLEKPGRARGCRPVPCRRRKAHGAGASRPGVA